MEWIVPPEKAGARLDQFTAGLAGATRAQIRQVQAGGGLTVNGRPVKDHYRLKPGDVVRMEGSPERPLVSGLAAEKIPLVVRYEDRTVMVIDKPAGMVVHPGTGVSTGTLANALLGRGGPLSTIGGGTRPGIVHRLDKDTSGLLIIAKTNAAHLNLAEQLKARTLHRVYLALVHGDVKTGRGMVDASMGRHPIHRHKLTVARPLIGRLGTRERNLRPGGTLREARTRYEVVERFGPVTLLRLELETGRTHQIRVHMQSIRHPVVGDTVYGGRRDPVPGLLMPRQALHAHRLGFLHPVSGKLVEVESPLPKDFQRVLKALRRLG